MYTNSSRLLSMRSFISIDGTTLAVVKRYIRMTSTTAPNKVPFGNVLMSAAITSFLMFGGAVYALANPGLNW